MNEIERAIDELTAQCGECSCLTDENTCTSDTDCFEAKRLAVISLREKLEREKGCDFCLDPDGDNSDNSIYIDHTHRAAITTHDVYVPISYCPMCGKKLPVYAGTIGGEIVQHALKELEAEEKP